jgi:diguanylate cyclase (GGDEF)-like protein
MRPRSFELIAVSFGLANLVGYVISIYLYTYRRRQFVAQHQEQQARLENERLATLDGLTQIFNRRRFMTLANEEFGRFRRYGHRFSLLLMDLDHFKHVNDTHGHAAGDVVLKGYAGLVGGLIRQSDSLGRLGGEEFAVMLPETPAADALQLAERIRAKAEATCFAAGEAQIRVTASIGVTEVVPGDESPEDTLRRADQALYAVKSGGRNGVKLAANSG